MHIANAAELQQTQQSQDDASLLVRFMVKPVEDRDASQKQGRPVFKDIEVIEIRTPGKRDAICRPARQRDIDRFPRHYEAFKARVSAPVDAGTPLSEWPQVSRSLAEELAFFNIKTVEQLADCPDGQLSKFMGGGMLKERAKKWLKLTQEYAAAEELQNELAKRDKEIEDLKAAVAELAAKPAKSAPKKKASARKKVTAKKE